MCAMIPISVRELIKIHQKIKQNGHWANYNLGWTVAHEAARNINLPINFTDFELHTATGWTVAHECALVCDFFDLDKYNAIVDNFKISVINTKEISTIIKKEESFIDYYFRINIVIDLLNMNDLFGLELLYEDVVNNRIFSKKFVFIHKYNIVENVDERSDIFLELIKNIYKSGFVDSNLKKYTLTSKFNKKFTLHLLSRYVNTTTINSFNVNIKYITSLSKDLDHIYENSNFYIYKFFADYVFSLILKKIFINEYDEYVVFHCNSLTFNFNEFLNFTNFEKYILKCTNNYNRKVKYIYSENKKIKIIPIIKSKKLIKEFYKNKTLILCIDFISNFSELDHVQYLMSGNHFKCVHVVCLSFDISKFTGPSGNSVGNVKLTSGTDRVHRRKNRSPS